jgi:YHS domain-containing protein/thiol-disulfide isomerase/thioredoxin
MKGVGWIRRLQIAGLAAIGIGGWQWCAMGQGATPWSASALPWGQTPNDGMAWQTNLEDAKRIAAQNNKLVLVHFWSPSCVPCKQLEKNVLSNPQVQQTIQARFVPIKLNADEHPTTAKQFGITRLPSDLIITPSGQIVGRMLSPPTPDVYLQQLAIAASGTGPVANPVGFAAVQNPARPAGAIPGTMPAAAPAWGPAAAATVQQSAQQSATMQPAAAVGAAPAGQKDFAWGSTPGNTTNSAPAVSAYSDSRYAEYYQRFSPPASNAIRPGAPATTAWNNPAGNPAIAPGSAAQATAAPYAVAPNAAVAPTAVVPPTKYITFPYNGTPVTTAGSGVAASSAPYNTAAAGSAPSAMSPAGAMPPPGRPYNAVPPYSPPTATSPGYTAPNLTPRTYNPAALTGPPTSTYVPPATTMTAQAAVNPAVANSAGSAAPLGMDGYSPVTLVEQQRWQLGDRRYGAVHRGRTYLFANAEEQQKFLANPDRYSPAISGRDVVMALDYGQDIDGRRANGAEYQNRIYLFNSEASRRAFTQNPQRYVSEVLQAEAADRATLR